MLFTALFLACDSARSRALSACSRSLSASSLSSSLFRIASALSCLSDDAAPTRWSASTLAARCRSICKSSRSAESVSAAALVGSARRASWLPLRTPAASNRSSFCPVSGFPVVWSDAGPAKRRADLAGALEAARLELGRGEAASIPPGGAELRSGMSGPAPRLREAPCPITSAGSTPLSGPGSPAGTGRDRDVPGMKSRCSGDNNVPDVGVKSRCAGAGWRAPGRGTKSLRSGSERGAAAFGTKSR